jgi:hypothetical protein
MMDAFYNSAGTRTRDYGQFAETTFSYNVSRWTGNPVEAMSLQPDLDQVDLRLKLPTLMEGRLDLVPNHIVLDWQIKHTSNPPRRMQFAIDGCSVPAIKVGMDKKKVRCLRDRVRADRGPFFLAYGVANQHSGRLSPLDEDPYEAFQWYAIDLAQYFNQVPDDCDVICIPIDNRLNLLTFSLLWASHWVREFYQPLTNTKVREYDAVDCLKPLDAFVTGIYQKGFSTLADFALMRDDLERKLPQLLQSLQATEAEKRQVSTTLALGATLEDIRAHFRVADPIQQISTYCPESLYGTASLWLFSRSYWKFMKESADAVTPRNRSMNRRWLPVRLDLRSTPRLLWSVLYCVVKLYERLDVDVIVVRPLGEHGIGADRSVYGGNIGHLPYISLSNDGLQWTREVISKGDEHSHRDFFAQASHDVIMGRDEPLTHIPALTDLPRSQLELSDSAPRLLFAREDIFIKHPTPLWHRILT